MRKLMGALILEGVVQVAQDAQDVFGPHGAAAAESSGTGES